MKTFREIYSKTFQHYWGRSGTLEDVAEKAAKEYAKLWIDEAAEVAMKQAEKGLPVGDAVYALKDLIDKQ